MRPPGCREGVSLVVRGLQNPSFCMKKSRTRNRHLSLRLIRLLFL